MNIRELEIIKAALEGDIIRQKQNDNADHPAFKQWLEDSEKLLKKVSRQMFEMKTRKKLFKLK
jgi:tRNA nucleotidyltransferase/poly(A) polymerase